MSDQESGEENIPSHPLVEEDEEDDERVIKTKSNVPPRIMEDDEEESGDEVKEDKDDQKQKKLNAKVIEDDEEEEEETVSKNSQVEISPKLKEASSEKESEQSSDEEKDDVRKDKAIADTDDEQQKDDKGGSGSDNEEDRNDEKKKKKKRRSSKDKRKKRKRDSGDDEGEEGGADNDDDDDEEEEEEEEVSDEEPQEKREIPQAPVYDFDIMMAKRKEENSKKRRRRNYDIINDNDDIIADIINQMRDAVEVDNEANRNKQAATRKLKLLPFLISQLRKVDLRDAFLDSDVLRVISDWLAPLPDRSLPHLHIREGLINILIDFNLYDLDKIKSSGIGKAIMYLYKHPKETKENKQKAKHLISCWSRPIFQLDSSFDSISREEREQRDLELLSKKRRVSQHQQKEGDDDGPGASGSGMRTGKEETAQKPGDKGWIPRARVPAPSMKDYVIRPRSTVDGEIDKSSKRSYNMLEKYMRNQQERRRASKQQRAVNMRIDRV